MKQIIENGYVVENDSFISKGKSGVSELSWCPSRSKLINSLAK